jgi:hypothetical protein
LTDVAADHPDVVERMDRQWRAIARRVGAQRIGKRVPATPKR